MKIVNALAILLVITGCKDAKKDEYTIVDNPANIDVVASNEHPGKKFMETLCYTCHDATTLEEARLGPPMVAIKRRYLMEGGTRDEFINEILAWTGKPSLQKAKMRGAVDRFGVMPYLAFPKDNIKEIAEYLYDNDIEKPEWFEEHYQKNQGNGQGMGKGRGMGGSQGKGMGKGKQMRKGMGQNDAPAAYRDIGLRYALSTKAQLGKNLMKAIQEKGTVGAVEFCNIEAMKLTDSMSVMHNAIIKRVSDKARNPKNMANAKELGHIATFKELVKAESDIDPIVEEINGEVNFYYPITTNTMCLQCHGTPNEQVTSETLSALSALYPSDKALGYTINEVRGIWSIVFNK